MKQEEAMELWDKVAKYAPSEVRIYEFAKLVAQEVRDRIMFGSRDDWVLAEREACAKLFDDRDNGIGFYEPHEPAEIIRARGQA